MKKKNKQTNRTGEASGSRLIRSAIPFPQTFPLARRKSSCGRKNARAAGPIMIEGLLACSKDSIAQVYKPITECNGAKEFHHG